MRALPSLLARRLILLAVLAALACSRRSQVHGRPDGSTEVAASASAATAANGSAPTTAVETPPLSSTPPKAPLGPPFRIVATPLVTGELIPGPGGGWTDDLVELEGAIFAATSTQSSYRMGGVFRSDDGGAHFRRSSKGLPRVRGNGGLVESSESAFDPYARVTALGVDHGVLLAGTERLQVYRSVNGGGSFSSGTGLPAPRAGDVSSHVWQLVTVGGRTHARTTHGVFVSADQGATWERAKLSWNGGAAHSANSLAVDGNVLYAAVAEGVIASEDEGATFRLTRLPDEPYEIQARRGVVWAASPDTTRPVYESRDRGKTFRPLAVAPEEGTRGPLTLHPFGIKRSTGADPQNMGFLLTNTRDVLDVGGAHLLATSGGVFRTRDRGASLERTAHGLCVARTERVGVTTTRLFIHLGKEYSGLMGAPLAAPEFRPVPYGGNLAHAFAARENELLVGDEQGRVFRSLDEGRAWQPVELPPPTPPGPVEVVAFRGKNRLLVRGGILVSRDGGASWKDIRAGFPLEPTEEFGSFHYRIACGDVTDHAVLLCGPAGVLRGTETEDWKVVSLPGDLQNVVAVANDDGRVLAATPSALYESHDDGKTFRVLASDPPSGLAISSVGAEKGEIVVTLGNSAARSTADGAAILFSRDRGGSWLRLSGELEFLPTAPPVRGREAWYVGLASDGVFRFSVPDGDAPSSAPSGRPPATL